MWGSTHVLDEPDLMIPVEAVGRLLQASATASGNESFGLYMARSRLLSNLGAVGLLMRDQATLAICTCSCAIKPHSVARS